MPKDMLINCLKTPTLPYVSGHAVSKLLKNNNVKCKVCVSTVSIGVNICEKEKEMVMCDISFLNERDKVSLVWPNENVVVLSKLVFSVFENVLSSEHNIKLIMQSASSSRVRLKTLKRIVEEKVSKCDAIKYTCCTCELCG